MANNQVIFLNGPSSAGKTTLSHMLQKKLDQPYLHFGIDMMIMMMPEHLNNWEGEKPSEGFWWQKEIDAEGKTLHHIQQGPFALKLSQSMKKVAVTLLNCGHNLIIDEVCLTSQGLQTWQQQLKSFNTLYVNVTAPIDVLEARERRRKDRTLGSARAQHTKIPQNFPYDLIINTHERSLASCAEAVIKHCD